MAGLIESVSASRGSEARTWGPMLARLGRVEEGQNTAYRPVAKGNSQEQTNDDGREQQK